MIPRLVRFPSRLPLKWLVVLGLGALLAVSIASVFLLAFSAARTNTDELLSVNIELILDGISARIDEHLMPVEQQALEIARGFREGKLSLDDAQHLEPYLAGVLAASPQVSAIAIVRPDNQMTAFPRQTMKLFNGPWVGRTPYEELLQSLDQNIRTRWRPPIWSERLKQVISTYHTVLEFDGRVIGILVQTVPVAELSRFLDLQLLMDGVPFIYYDDNKLIAHPKLISWQPAVSEFEPPERPVPAVTIQDIGEALLEEIIASPGHPLGIITKLKRTTGKVVEYGERHYVLFTRTLTRYGAQPWTLGFYFDRSRADASIVLRLMTTLAVGILLLVLSVSLAMYAGARFSRPIRSLARAMMQVKQGAIADVVNLPRSRISEIDDASQSFNEMTKGLRERDLIRQTLGRYVPAKVAETLLQENGALETEEAIATVLFADMEGFTLLTETLGPEGIVALLNAYFSDMVEIIERHGGVVTQFQGDAILATFNIPIKAENHAERALLAAREMRQLNLRQSYNGHQVRTRIGVNSGPLIAGAVGAQGRLNYTVHGDAVNLAARLESLNKDFGTYILTTQATIEGTRGLATRYVGETTVRGQSSAVRLYTLAD